MNHVVSLPRAMLTRRCMKVNCLNNGLVPNLRFLSSSTDEAAGKMYRTYVDQKTQVTYYSHKRTHKTTWRPPHKSVKPLWYKRFAAGFIDVGVSMAAAMTTNVILLFELDDVVLAGFGAAAGFALTFLGRDAIADKGTRSYGKRYMQLEDIDILIEKFQSIKILKGIPFQGPSPSGCIMSRWCWNDKLPEFAEKFQNKNVPYISFHRYGASGMHPGISLGMLMQDPKNLDAEHVDGIGRSLAWIDSVLPLVEATGAELVWGEGNSITGSGRKSGISLAGMVRSYKAGFLWGFNMLFEISSRGVKRGHIHGIGGANFAPIYTNLFDKDADNYKKLIVTPIYFSMYLFSRLLDGAEDSVTISVPSIQKAGPSSTDIDEHRHYLVTNPSKKRSTLVLINKGPNSHSANMDVSIPAANFCPDESNVYVDVISKKQRPAGDTGVTWDESHDNFVPSFNRGIFFNKLGHLKAHGKLQLGFLRAVDGDYSFSVDPLTVVLVHCYFTNTDTTV